MANVLTNLAGDIFKAADTVSRELIGLIPAVTINGDGSERAAVGDPIRSHFTRSATAVNRNVAMTISEGTDQTVDSKTVTITKDRAVEIPWTGEDIRHVNNGSGFTSIYGDQFAQSFRTLTNEIESDLATLHATMSRAYGTAGTTPFGTAGDFSDAAFAKKILVDNGAPESDNHIVMNTTAGATIQGKQAQANITGTDSIQRQGILLPLAGLDLRQSAQIVTHTKGTGTGYLVNNASAAIGDTVIPADTGTGTILAGDVVTIAGDTNQYVVATALSAGSFTIADPGLRVAVANNAAITVVGTAAHNMVFNRSAIELVARAPALPVINGQVRDAAVDRMTVVDPRSGLPFDVAVYLGQGKAMIQIAMAWGFKNWKPEHTALLLG